MCVYIYVWSGLGFFFGDSAKNKTEKPQQENPLQHLVQSRCVILTAWERVGKGQHAAAILEKKSAEWCAALPRQQLLSRGATQE